jgi:diguanylate cyclase (GGDEF)-like protein/PAS domain S-box-containing protein
MLFERNAAGVYRASLDGEILECNESFARMLGCNRIDDMLGENLSRFSTNAGEREALRSMLEDTGALSGVELRLKRCDGRDLWVLENLLLVVDSHDETLIEGTVVDISSLKIAEEQMEFQAYHDVLTLLPNRRLFVDRLTLAIARTKRTKDSLAVMFIDLDHFKKVNDTFGHAAGDRVLRTIADFLRASVRRPDEVFRYGGEEFLVVLAAADTAGLAILERIHAAWRRQERATTFSAGIAVHRDGDHFEATVERADGALYDAKRMGRNRVVLASDPA